MCRPNGCCFYAIFGLKMGIDFAHLGMESGISFEGVYECNCCLNSW